MLREEDELGSPVLLSGVGTAYRCPLLWGSDQHNDTDNPTHSRRRLYIGLKAIHVNGTVFFALLQVSRRNRRLLPLWRRPDALLQLHEPCHVRGDELVFDSWGRGPVIAVVVVTVHQRWGVHHGFGLTDQRHLGVTGDHRKLWDNENFKYVYQEGVSWN